MMTIAQLNQELSWAIVIIGEYLGTDIAWTNGFGEKLHFEDLVRYELDANVEGAVVAANSFTDVGEPLRLRAPNKVAVLKAAPTNGGAR